MKAIARQLSLIAGAAASMAVHDPVYLTVQAARRLPAPARRRAAGLAGFLGARTGTGHVLSLWLADRRSDAVDSLIALDPAALRSNPLLAEVAVMLGRPDLGRPCGGPAAARAAWQQGHLSEAVQQAHDARARRLHHRYAAELALAQPGARARTPRQSRAVDHGRGVLHILTNSLPHTSSGYTLRSHAVLRALRSTALPVAAVTRLGYPAVVGRVSPTGTDMVDGIPYHRLLPWALPQDPADRAYLSAQMICRLAAPGSPALLHTTTPSDNGLVTRAAAESLGVPWVYEVRGLHEHTWVAGHPTAAARRHAAASERFHLARAREAAVAVAADHVVTLSRTMQEDLVARGVPTDRITIVPNAVDEGLLRRDEPADDARRALGLPEADLWVGTVGSLVDYEGLDVLIDAVALLRGSGLDVRACLVGDGVARPELAARARRAGIADHVLLPGRVDRTEAPRWCQALDAVVVPRRDVEVCRLVTPLKPVEAMALRRPVVLSDLPALAELADDGAGTLVPPEDVNALATTLDAMCSPQRRRRTVEAGYAAAASRTWASNAGRYQQVYRALGVSA